MIWPAALDLVNTVRMSRGALQDTLPDWLAEHGLPATAELEVLRDAVRSVVASVVDGRPVPTESLAVINAAAEAAPSWPRLEGDLTVTEVSGDDPAATALAGLARSAITLLGGPDRHLLRNCQNPRCVLYFVQDHPRRRSCSAACGTRARVARHYQRVHGDRNRVDGNPKRHDQGG